MARRLPRQAVDPLIELLLEIMDQAFDRKGWHGTTLRGALRGVTPAQALWRPGPDRHNVWELTVHAAYWKARSSGSRATGPTFRIHPT
jgi:hypothetical protein